MIKNRLLALPQLAIAAEVTLSLAAGNAYKRSIKEEGKYWSIGFRIASSGKRRQLLFGL